MPTLRFLNTILLLFPALLCCVNIATAAEQTYVREYIYQASEADSKLSARAIALQEVKRELLSELGTHVSSLVKLNTSSDGTQLGTEEIETLSAGVTRVEILNEKWDGVTYVLKAQIKADPADVLKSLEKMLDADKKQKQVSQLEGDVSQLRMQNINVSESLTQAKKETTAALGEIARLKKQLEIKLTDAARQTLQAEYKQQVDTLTLNEWFESGNAYYQMNDYANAFRLFKKAGDQGHATAQSKLGFMYLYGKGVPVDDVTAVIWFRKAANQGDANAQFHLGDAYKHGFGVPQDDVQAIIWYRKATDQENANAQFKLGFLYYMGNGVPQDYAQAVAWYRKAADQGFSPAQDSLGDAYRTGEGVPQDYAQAVAWYRKAADQGYGSAQFQLGILYDLGQGVPQNYAQAAAWFRKAADKGDKFSQFNLGDMYEQGQGVPQDYAQAIAWYRKAAEQGYGHAQFQLGVMYANGEGVAQDTMQAFFWWRKAAAQGHQLAQEALRKANATYDIESDPIFKALEHP